MKQPRLTIELVPDSTWYENLRSILVPAVWDGLRRATYRAAKYQCEICGGKGKSHPVECHEIWNYDDKNHRQILDRLIALCPACHQVKHIGLAQLQGFYDQAITHLATVNEWNAIEAQDYVKKQFEIWEARCRYEWSIDIGSIEKYLCKVDY